MVKTERIRVFMMPASECQVHTSEKRNFKKTNNNVIDLKARLRRWRSEIWREDAAHPIIRGEEDQRIIDISDLQRAKDLRDAADIITGNFEGIGKKEEMGIDSKDFIKKATKALQRKDKKRDKGLKLVPDIEVGHEHNIIGRVDVSFWRRNRSLRQRTYEKS